MKKNRNPILHQKTSGRMIFMRMLSHLPFQILTCLSTTLFTLVDGFVASHYLGANALGSVNLISPLSTFVGLFCGVIGSGVSISLSKAMVDPDRSKVQRVYKAAVILILITTVFIALAEFPVAKLIIDSYHLEPEMHTMVWSYSYGMLIAFAFGVVSTVGSFMLVATGKVKTLMALSVAESVLHLGLDLFFIGRLHLGVAGAGYAAAISNFVRASFTVILVLKLIPIFPLIKGPCLGDMLTVIRRGSYRFYSTAVLFIKNYFINIFILRSVGADGYSAYSVACFAITVANALANAVTQSSEPFYGMLSGIGDWKNARTFLRKSMWLTFVIMVPLFAAMFSAPQLLFGIYSIKNASSMQLTIVRIMAFMILAQGPDKVIQSFMTYCRMKELASIASALQHAVILLPAALLLCRFTSMGVFMAFTVANVLALIFGVIAFQIRIHSVKAKDNSIASLDLKVRPAQRNELSKGVFDFFFALYHSKSLANRLSLCAEEGVAHVQPVALKPLSVDLIFRAFRDKVVLFILNNGKDESTVNNIPDNPDEPIVNNYLIMRKLADKYSYQKICGLNSYTMEFLLDKGNKTRDDSLPADDSEDAPSPTESIEGNIVQ